MIPALLIAAVFGLIVGSFLNVCIYRLPRRESVTLPGSHCPICRSPIRWYDNIPILSYAALGGRCRGCRTPIAVTYPLVEISTALVFSGLLLALGPGPLLASRVIFSCAVIVLFVIDLQHRILPNAITLPGIVVGFLFSFFAPPGWLDSLVGIVLGGAVPLAMYWGYYLIRREEGLGMGDVKMLAMIGAFLGWKLMLLTLVIASFAGSIVGLGIIALGHGDMKYALPFGTFLAVGSLVAAIAGDWILGLYLSFY